MNTAVDGRRKLRQEMRSWRAALEPRQRMQASLAVADHLRALAELRQPRSVAAYWAVRSELPLLHTVNALQRAGHNLFLPMIQHDGALRFGRWQPGAEMQPNRFGIPEPVLDPDRACDGSALDLVLVPMLAFDRTGNRLGSGAGYYDRSFAALAQGPRPRKPVLVGIAYAGQEVSALPNASWDVRLDYVVTERELIATSAL